MDNQGKTEIGSPYWIARQREICNQAIALEDGAPPCSIPLLKQFAQDEITALDALEAKTKLLNRVLPEGTPAWMAYNTPTAMTRKDAAIRIREHMRHHGISEPQSIGISTALLMAADALERESEKDAEIERMKAKADTARITKEDDAFIVMIKEDLEEATAHDNYSMTIYRPTLARLVAMIGSLTAERDAANEIIARIDYQLEKHQTCAAMGNRQYAHGIRDARKIIAQMLPACAENAPDAEAAAKEARGDVDRN